MGNAEAHVSCGILPWSAAQGRYLIQQIFLFCAWIKSNQEKWNLLQQMLSSSWQSRCLGLVSVQGVAQLLEEFNKWETLNYYIPSIQVLIWGNIKEMCLCLWCQWAWRLKDFRNKPILKALSDIFHPELEGNQYMVEDFRILNIHLRKRDSGTKIIQLQSLLTNEPWNWRCSCLDRRPGGWFPDRAGCWLFYS